MRDHFQAGARAGWAASAQKRAITEYRPRKQPVGYWIGDTLPMEAVILAVLRTSTEGTAD